MLIEQLYFEVMLPQQLADSVKGRVEEQASNSWGGADSSVTGQCKCVSSRR